MTALEMSHVRELTTEEIDATSGAGFFERVGRAMDNPYETFGALLDYTLSVRVNTGDAYVRRMVASGV